VLRDRQ